MGRRSSAPQVRARPWEEQCGRGEEIPEFFPLGCITRPSDIAPPQVGS